MNRDATKLDGLRCHWFSCADTKILDINQGTSSREVGPGESYAAAIGRGSSRHINLVWASASQ